MALWKENANARKDAPDTAPLELCLLYTSDAADE